MNSILKNKNIFISFLFSPTRYNIHYESRFILNRCGSKSILTIPPVQKKKKSILASLCSVANPEDPQTPQKQILAALWLSARCITVRTLQTVPTVYASADKLAFNLLPSFTVIIYSLAEYAAHNVFYLGFLVGCVRFCDTHSSIDILMPSKS